MSYSLLVSLHLLQPSNCISCICAIAKILFFTLFWRQLISNSIFPWLTFYSLWKSHFGWINSACLSFGKCRGYAFLYTFIPSAFDTSLYLKSCFCEIMYSAPLTCFTLTGNNWKASSSNVPICYKKTGGCYALGTENIDHCQRLGGVRECIVSIRNV